FTFLAALASGVLFGLAPAFTATRRHFSRALASASQRGTSGRNRLRSAFVVAEIALALVLLVGAGLMVKSFLRLRAVDLGFQPQNVVSMTVDLPDAKYRTAAEMQAFHTRVLERLSALPSVQVAGAVNWRPLCSGLIRGDFALADGRKLPRHYSVDKPAVSAGYFRAMG